MSNESTSLVKRLSAMGLALTFAVRVGAGGSTHTFETVNGDIVVRRAR